MAAATTSARSLRTALQQIGQVPSSSLGRNLAASTAQIRGVRTNLLQAQGAAAAAARSVSTIVGAAASAGRAITSSINGALQRAVSLAGRVGRGIRGVGRGVLGVGKGLLTGAGLVGTGFGINAIREAVSWQQQLAKIDTIARLSKGDLNNLGQSMQDLALRFGIDINDMASAEYEFLSAGIGVFRTIHNGHVQIITDYAEQKGALQAASEFSVATLSTQTDAVRTLSFALNAYNLNQKVIPGELAKEAGLYTTVKNGVQQYAGSLSEAADVISNQLAKAVEIGVVTGPQIASSFATVAASAKVAGIGIDEIAAAYAAQTTRGVSASRVTTSMNRAIQDLIKPGTKLKDLMKETGHNYAQIARTQGIHVALQQMRTDANKAGIGFAELFKRQEGWRFALNVTQDNLKDASGNFRLYQAVLQQIRDSTTEVDTATGKVGTAAIQAERRMHTVGREFDRVRIGFKILSETIGRPLLEPIAALLRFLTGLEISMFEWARANQKVIEQLGPVVGFVSALLALTAGTQGLLFALQPIAPLLGTTATNLRGMATIIGRLVFPFAIIVGLLGTFNFLVSNNIRGFGQFSGVLDDMRSVAAGVGEVFATIAHSLSYIWETIGNGGDVAAAVAQSADLISRSINKIEPAFKRVVGFLARAFLSIGGLIVEGLQRVIPAIAQWLVSVAKALVPGLGYLTGRIIGWARTVVPQILGALGDFGGEVVAWLQRTTPVVIAAFNELLGAIADWAASVVPTILKSLGDIAGQLGAWVAGIIPVIGHTLDIVTVRMQNWVRTNGPRIVAALGSWAQSIANWFGNDLFPAVQRGISEWLNKVVRFLQDTQIVRRVVGFLVTALAGIAAFIASHAGEIVGLFVEIARQVIGGFTDFIREHGSELVAAGISAGAALLHALAQFILSHPGEVITAIATVFAIAAAAGAVISAVGLLRNVLIGGLGLDAKSATGRSVWSLGLQTVLVAAFNGARAVVIVAAQAAGFVAGEAYAAGVKIAAFLQTVLVGIWEAVATSPIVKAASSAAGAVMGQFMAAGAAVGNYLLDALVGLWMALITNPTLMRVAFMLGEATGSAMAAGVAVGNFLLDSLIGMWTLVIYNPTLKALAFRAGNAWFGDYGMAASLAIRGLFILAFAGIAKWFSDTVLMPISLKLHDFFMNLKLPLPTIDFKQLHDLPWPLGSGKPDWAKGGPLEGPVEWLYQQSGDTSGQAGEKEAKKYDMGFHKTLSQLLAQRRKDHDFSSGVVPELPTGPVGDLTKQNGLLSIFRDNLLRGINDINNTPGPDWLKILQKDDATKNLDDLKTEFDTTFATITGNLSNQSDDLKTTISGFFDKNGVVKKFKSDKQAIKDLETLRKQAVAAFTAAQDQGSNATAALILASIAKIDGQISALKGAGEIVTAGVADLAAQTAKENAVIAALTPGISIDTLIGQNTAPTPKAPPKPKSSPKPHKGAGPEPQPHIQEPTVGKTGFVLPKYMQLALSGELNPPPKPKPIPINLVPADQPRQSIDTYISNALARSTAATVSIKTNVEGTNKSIDQYISDAVTGFSALNTSASSTTASANAATSTVTANAVAAAGVFASTLGGMVGAANSTGVAAAGAIGSGLAAAAPSSVNGADAVVSAVNATLNTTGPVANGLGFAAGFQFSLGLGTSINGAGGVRAAALAVAAAVASVLNSVSWYSYGYKLVESFIQGMKDATPGATKASHTLAAKAGQHQVAGSPPKSGPNKKIRVWGAELVRQYALGMESAVGLVSDASMSMARAVVTPGPREIAPVGMAASAGGGYGGGGMSSGDRHMWERQTELLADIAAATQVGAAASAHGAARDPRAGGPLSARSALVSYKQLSTSRSRGGL